MQVDAKPLVLSRQAVMENVLVAIDSCKRARLFVKRLMEYSDLLTHFFFSGG